MNLDKCKLVGIFGSLPGVLFILLVSFLHENCGEDGASRAAPAPRNKSVSRRLCVSAFYSPAGLGVVSEAGHANPGIVNLLF